MPPTNQPHPGDLVFIELRSEGMEPTGQTSHVGVVESINDDGSVNTIEGNFDREYVVRNVRYREEITGFGGSTQ